MPAALSARGLRDAVRQTAGTTAVPYNGYIHLQSSGGIRLMQPYYLKWHIRQMHASSDFDFTADMG